ncbi:MAG: CARDB domain-containing protein, partial [Caldilinea sp.]
MSSMGSMLQEFWRLSVRRGLLFWGMPILLCAALAWLGLTSAQAATDSGPDLTVEIQMIPAVPNPNETATARMIFRNRGTATSAAAVFHFYQNPADRPPTQATATSYFSGVPSLPPGGSFQFDRGVTFTSAGCDHIVYAWVDRDQVVADADRSNNLVGLPVCVGVQCEVDAFESDDNSDNAGWLMVGASQQRSFCRNTNSSLSTQGDQDWVKFTAFTGLTYTLASTAPGIHADPRITLWSGGMQQVLDGPGDQIVWQPPASGVYFAQVRNSDDKDGSGPLSGYTLGLAAVPAVT